jgi:crossover junction endodeoxyribonuclease RuvC
MTILGIDPGTARLGFGVVRLEGSRVIHVAHGCLETPAGTPQADRLRDLHLRLAEVIERHRPGLIGIEQLFFAKNARTAMAVSEARGVVLLTARLKGIDVREHAPVQVKSAVVGYGRADKRQVQEMVRRLFRLDRVPEPDDAADALAVAYCTAVSYERDPLRSHP